MKTTKKILSVLLVFAMLSCLLVSCGKDKGEIIAQYNENEYVYEKDTDYNDFFMLKSYQFIVSNGSTTLTDSQYNSIVEEAVKDTIVLREMKKQFKELGYSVDADAVKEAALSDAKYFDENYKGGYATFVSTWSLSEGAFTMFNEYDLMLQMAAEKIKGISKPTETEAYDYYIANSDLYVVPPHYSIGNIVLEATDTVSKETALADANSYIAMLKGGKSWDEVKSAAAIKYNYENGMMYSEMFTGIEKKYLSTFEPVNDLDAAIAEIDAEFEKANKMSFKEMFPNGFDAYLKANNITEEDTEKYNAAKELHYNYSAKVYSVTYNHLITTEWEDGKTYSTPIWHDGINAYVIVTFNSVVDKSGFKSFDDVKESIIEEIYSKAMTEATERYKDEIFNKAFYGITK